MSRKVYALVAFVLAMMIFPLQAEVIDINSATAAQISSALAGIGPAKAEAIVAYRNANGSFKSIDDLLKVKGIGPATLQKIANKLQFGAVAPAAKAAAQSVKSGSVGAMPGM
ncbi:helix-hairpin-helix domain-containing protein [Ectothiorhodospiraceae bacterium BW-2]|nr:helix-hairpin-helix domain-containing protein [Ectothiorhodospiraceae bacterium BW-2]